ncbi:MAG: L-serine ammonia-lyase, iron-sulfur-dependent, subunit alpha [Bacteroidaceae bacterium]|nr:L-serine ammonia-lyase, iron-sulfur-dependent, subunit alpha [Prevotellaceae bacterium]MDY5631407.1 L-serine ammonia-lyase, iron-sulfur-dependent, subunit alpha [Bacteroidaceae bacterium]
MDSLRQLFRIGKGPSSSHTIAPTRAATMFSKRFPQAKGFEVTLYGSLAATGKGHLTDVAILQVLEPLAPTTIVWRADIVHSFHTNGMLFRALDNEGQELGQWTVYSVGGGALSEGPGKGNIIPVRDIYPLHTLAEIQQWCQGRGAGYWQYVEECEGPEIWDFLHEIWETMKQAVRNGLENEGTLPGPLNLSRKASNYYVKAQSFKPSLQGRSLVYAYALAVSEENASGGTIVTAPTCGASGVVPAVLYHLEHGHGFTETKMLRALATAGLFGNVVKQNASISGAEVGCQGEVGVACAMASAAACQLFGGTPAQIEYAAEMGLEHHLGMTCDPVCGLVQIPCIERNAFAACRALDAQLYANISDGQHQVSFDHVVEVMKQTGHDLPSLYKETAEGGLAKSSRFASK